MAKPSPAEKFSEREQEIVRLLGERTRNKEIAIELKVSVPTVRTHLRTIYLKLRVRSRAEAIKKLNRPTAETNARQADERPPRPAERAHSMDHDRTSAPGAEPSWMQLEFGPMAS